MKQGIDGIMDIQKGVSLLINICEGTQQKELTSVGLDGQGPFFLFTCKRIRLPE